MTDYEIALICHNGAREINGKRIGSVWNFAKVNPNEMVHPTEKPEQLLERLATYFSLDGELIFDPFMGSGTTAIACLKTNRRFIGCEISPKYCDIANKRISDFLAQGNLFS